MNQNLLKRLSRYSAAALICAMIAAPATPSRASSSAPDTAPAPAAAAGTKKKDGFVNEHPNIIMILTDDLGYGDISAFNPESKIRTPNIDKLASDGRSFTDCHASASVCTPSRYSLLTGRYNWRSRLKSTLIAGTSRHLIEDGRLTVAQLLRQAGYRTACVGKWHLGMDWQKSDPNTVFSDDIFVKVSDLPDWGIAYDKPIQNGPNAYGFDYFFGMAASLDQPPYVFIENQFPVGTPKKLIGDTDCDHISPNSMYKVERGPAAEDWNFEQAVPICDRKVLSLIDEYSKSNQPFFIYYSTLAVHSPLVPLPEFKGKSGIGDYGDFVLQLDDFIGKLTAKLEEKNLTDNTIVIFTSDNGCSTVVDIPALQKLGHFPSYHFRGVKADIWEGGHRIPFIVRWPGHIEAGTTSDATVCLVDMLATFAELTGQTYGDDAGEDSISELPLWLGQKQQIREYTVHHSVFGCFSIRKGAWKLEMCPGCGSFNEYPADGNDTSAAPEFQLYNLAEDVGEKNNLYGQYPEITAELKAVLTEYIQRGRSTPGAPQYNFPVEKWPGLEWLADR